MQKLRIATCIQALAGLLLLAGPAMALGGSGAEFGARDPGGCPSIQLNGPPSPDQVVTMLRCQHEVALDTGQLWLMENVKVQVGKGVPFVEADDSFVMPDADIMSTAYNIRASFTYAVCMTVADAAIYNRGDATCEEMEMPAVAQGICWQTSFGDYRCRVVGPTTRTGRFIPPPQ